jgi:RNA polymerase sigma factor (sigma-70 family)
MNTNEAATGDEPADDVLLERFTAQREQAAFATLVRRHGPMVLGVCRRVLQHEQDAEDAFQAVFCVLARKAGAIRRGTAVGGWLYAVACRIARKAKTLQVRRRMRESELPDVPAPDNPPEWEWRDLWPILDEEVSRLPERYRLPFVLCHLEGKTNQEAAAELHCPPGTVSSRLTRARERLRARLARRGLALSVGALAAAVSRQTATAAVRSELAQTAVQTGLGYSAGLPVAERAADLANGFLKAQALTRWALSGAALLAVLLVLMLVLIFLRPRHEKLEGSWQVDDVKIDGNDLPHEDMRLVFKDGQMTMLSGNFLMNPPMPYVLDPFHEPKTIDISSPHGGVWRGIYKLNGDSMTLCLNQNGATGNRPATFQAQSGAKNVFLYVLRRARAGAGGP